MREARSRGMIAGVLRTALGWAWTPLSATLLAAGCAGATPDAGETALAATGTRGEDGGSSRDEGGSESTAGGPPRPPPSACATPTELTAAPQTIGEAIEFINALPHPVTLDCFVQQLQRPLPLNATFSRISLQPALGVRSPRVFLFYGDLIMSVAVDGDPGARLLEFGELVAPTKSIKGEVEFPIEEVLAASAPMERVFDGKAGSECRICHGGESEAPDYDFAYASDALAFQELELVPLSDMRAEYETCNPELEPARCVRLGSLLNFGPVIETEFPPQLQTIYDY